MTLPIASRLRLVARGAAARSDRPAGRTAARRALSALEGIDADRIELVHRDGAPPRALVIDRDGRPTELRAALTLTHCDGRAIAVASTLDSAIGVDLERDTKIEPSHARYFLTARERVCSRSLVESWVLKEAAWKALRLREDTALADLELSFDAAGMLRGVAHLGVWERACARIARPWPGFIAALVVVGSWQ